MDKPIPEAVAWPFSILEAGNWREVYMGTKHMRLEVSYPYEVWERLMAALTAAQQQGQAAPPSAPVGVEQRAREAVALALDEAGHHTEANNVRKGIDLDEYRVELSAARIALAQQPAAVDEEECPHSAIGGCDVCATQHQEPTT